MTETQTVYLQVHFEASAFEIDFQNERHNNLGIKNVHFIKYIKQIGLDWISREIILLFILRSFLKYKTRK